MNGAALRKCRERLRISRQEMATVYGITDAQLSRIENGYCAVQRYMETIIRIFERYPEIITETIEEAVASMFEELSAKRSKLEVKDKIEQVAKDIAKSD